MNQPSVSVKVHILDSQHTLSCEPHERELLMRAAALFDQILQDIRQRHPQTTTDKILILGGVQLAFQLLQERQTFDVEVKLVNQIVAYLGHALDQSIGHEQIADDVLISGSAS